MTMSDERFNQLLNGPLSHPLPICTLTRITLGLRHVLDVCGEPADKALEEYCREREERDQLDDLADPHGEG